VLLVGGAVALLGTAEGFRWLTGGLAALSQGRLKIEGVEGHLLAPLSVRHLEINRDTTRIRIEHAHLEWRPRALWNRSLDIRLLSAQRVEVETLKPSVEPAQVPTSLRLPFGIALEPAHIDLAQLDIRQAGQTLHFSAIRLGVVDAGDAWRLQLGSFVSAWAKVDGQAQLGKDAPFLLAARLDAAHDVPMPVTVALGLQGRLEAIAFKLDAAAKDMTFHASGEVAPFAGIMLPHLLVVGQGIDPARLVEGAPVARLSFSGLFEEQPGKRLLGTFSLHNARAGKLNAQRLPLVELSGAVLGDVKHADFSALNVDLGEVGRLTGGGQWRAGRFGLNLASDRLNLAGLHGSFYPSRIRTALQLSGDAERQHLRAEVAGSYGQGQFVVTHDAAKLALETADFTGLHGGHVSAQASLNLTGGRAFAAKLDLARFNPARFGAFPQGQLNARGQIDGALTPDFNIKARFELPPGELEGNPVTGKGRLHYARGRLDDTEVDVNLAGNRAQVRGEYEKSRMRMNWVIHAPALERLGRLGLRYLGVEFAGQLDSEGTLSGPPARPQIKMNARARALRLPGGLAADSLDMQLDLQTVSNGAFNGKLLGRGLALGDQTVSFAHIGLQGRRAAHVIGLEFQLKDGSMAAGSRDWHAVARLQGGLDDALIWRGRLLAADIEGAWPAHLLAPATLRLGRDAQRVDAAEFSFAGGRVALDMLEHQAGRLVTRGNFNRLPATPVLTMLDKPLPLTTNLQLGGEWDIRLAEALDGHVAVRRQSGDVTLTDPVMKLGLTALNLDLLAAANQITARLDANSTEAGRIHAEGHTRLVRESGKLVLLRSAPLAWVAQASLPDMHMLRPFLPLGTKADARLAFDLAGSGTWASPVLNGTLAADGIHFSMQEAGIGIRDGTIKLKLDDNTASVSEGVLEGQTGHIRLQGSASWRNPAGGLTLSFEKFAAITRSDRRLWLSGTTRLSYAEGRIRLDGDLRADKARLEMPESSRPRLSNDVVIVGQAPRPASKARRIPLDINLRFDLGEDFLFKGGGLDARLGGQIRVFNRDAALRGEGSIQVKKGRYSAYGQTLDVVRGVLTFTGPLETPALDILAVRKTGDVTAGVKVSGTAERPLVNLYSDPAMPDTETLSWLVFGHGLDKGDSAKFGLMQVMAGALLSQAESASLQGKLADALAIDSFEVRGGENGEDLSTTVVSVGKRINSKLMMNYEQSLDGLEQIVKAVYQISPKFRVEAATGSQSSLDVFYSLEFD
jgi:translocation and assembly module TamB